MCNESRAMYAFYLVLGDRVVYRGCASAKEENKVGCESQSVGSVKGTDCFCNSDLCNGASVKGISIVPMMALFVFSAVVATRF